MMFNHCSVCMCMCVMYVTYLCIYILCIGLLHHDKLIISSKKVWRATNLVISLPIFHQINFFSDLP